MSWLKPLDWKNFFMCVHTPSLLLYKAYTVELTDVSTAPLKFGVMIASQFYPLCDGRVVVPKHPHIELYITIEDILDSVAHHIELQADAGYLVVVRGKRDFGGQSAGHRGLQHFRVVTAGIEGAQVLFKVSFPLGAVSVRIDGGAQIVQLHFSAVSDVDAIDPHRGIQQKKGNEHHYADHKKAGEESDFTPFVAEWPSQPPHKMLHRPPHFQ